MLARRKACGGLQRLTFLVKPPCFSELSNTLIGLQGGVRGVGGGGRRGGGVRLDIGYSYSQTRTDGRTRHITRPARAERGPRTSAASEHDLAWRLSQEYSRIRMALCWSRWSPPSPIACLAAHTCTATFVQRQGSRAHQTPASARQHQRSPAKTRTSWPGYGNRGSDLRRRLGPGTRLRVESRYRPGDRSSKAERGQSTPTTTSCPLPHLSWLPVSTKQLRHVRH
jgi:hypothetical protein